MLVQRIISLVHTYVPCRGRSLFFILLIIGYGAVTAAAQRALPAVKIYPKTSLNVAGLPQALLVDGQNRIWVGSTNGLAVFDGTTFVPYDDRSGLADNFITDIEMSPDGTVFVASQKGICRFTGNPMRPFERLKGMEDMFFTTTILPLTSDSILFGDIKLPGLHTWSKGKVDVKDVMVGTENAIFDIIKTPEAIFLAQSDFVFRMQQGRVDSTPISPNLSLFTHLYKGVGNRAYASGGKAYRLTPAGVADSIPQPPGAPGSRFVYTSLNDGRLLALQHGVWEYQNGHWDTLVDGALLSSNIENMAFATAHTLWVCGDFGIARIMLQDEVTAYPITALYGFAGKTGQLMNGIGNEAHTAASKPFVAARTLNDMYVDRTGRTWYLTAKGIYWREGGVMEQYKPKLPEAEGNLGIYSALEDSRGRVWFGTDHGIFFYDGHDFVQPAFKKEEQPYEHEHWLANGRDGRLFIGGMLQVVQLHTDDPVHTIKVLGSAKTMNCAGVFSDGDGNIWSILESRIRKIMVAKDGSMQLKDSLPPVSILGKQVMLESLAFDQQNNLWVLGNGYLMIYLHQPPGRPYSAAKMILLTSNDYPGPLNGANAGLIYPGGDGKMLVIRNQTAFRMDAETVIRKAQQQALPVLQLSDVQQNEAPTDWAAAGYKMDGGIPVNPVFSDSVRRVTFRFSANNTVNAAYLTYEYQLDGYDTRWIDNGTSGTISFNRLPAGTYTLRVRARDVNRRVSNAISYPFEIMPPWYKRWWALTIWTLLLTGAVALVFYLRLRTLRRRANIQRLLVEQQLKALRAQINPHFLQNTFDFMSRMLDRQPIQRSREVILQLSSYLRHVLDLTDETIVRMEDELAFSEEYLAVNQLIFPDSFNYVIDIADDVDIFGVRMPSMILQPLLENAIKHGVSRERDAKTQISIRVYADQQTEYAFCEISNTMLHQETSRPVAGYRPKGLAITEQRLQLLYNDPKRPPAIRVAAAAGRHTITIAIPA